MRSIDEKYVQVREFYQQQSSKSIDFRIQQLEALYRLLVNEERQLLEALKQDLNKSYGEGYITEIMPVKSEIAEMIFNLDEYLEPKSVDGLPIALWMDRIETRKVPLGTVLIISPWNYPINLLLLPLAGALAGGNTVIVKPSEIAPNVSKCIASLLGKYLHPGAVQIVEGGVEETTALLNMKFDLIFYTGSTHVGKIIMSAAAANLTPVVLELGGKSPCIIDSTVDVNIAAKRIVWGKNMNCGQTCIAPDFVLIDKKLEGPFLKALQAQWKEILAGDAKNSPHYGRIISQGHFKRLKSLLDRQLEDSSSKLVFGGSSDESTLFIEPTVFTVKKSSTDAPLMEGELFGPILPVIAVDSVDDAIKYCQSMNQSPLSLYVFTNEKSVYEKIFSKINAGHAVVNDTLMNALVGNLPFGGVNESGMGAYHGKYSINTFTRDQGYMIRSIFSDLGNWPRYPNISGVYKSFWWKVATFAFEVPMPSKATVFLVKVFRKLGGWKTVFGAFCFLLGYKRAQMQLK